MLKVFRENIKYLSWILWVVIALFVLFVFVDFGSNTGRQGGSGSWAARVGGETVSMVEYQRNYKSLEARVKQMYGDQFSPELEKQMHLHKMAVDTAINDKIMLAEAKRIGLRATDAELRDRILAIPGFQDEQGRFVGADRYARVLAQNGWSADAFERELRNEILARKLDDALAAAVHVGDDEVEKSYREQVERAKIRYVEVPRSRFVQAMTIPQGELTAYFNAHKQEYRLPELREGAYLLVEPSRLLDQIKVEDADLQAYYKDHPKEFTREEQVRARQILVMVNDKRSDAEARQRSEDLKKRLEKGADFAAVAREVSDDAASKPNGGDLGFFGRGKMVREFEDAAFGAEPHKLVGPVKSPFGYHLVEVTERRQGGVQPFAEVREQIRGRLAFEKARQTAEARAHELARRVADAKPKSADALAAFAKDNPGVSFAATGKFGQQDPVAGLGLAQQFNAAAAALKPGGVSDAVQVPRGWAILFLERVLPAHIPELAEVEPKVRLALSTQKQQQMAIDQLAAKRKEMALGKTLDQVAAELGTAAKESAEFGAQGSIPGLGYSPQVSKAALALGPGQVGGPVPDAQGAMLFQVAERKGWDPAKFASVREQTRQTLQQERLRRLKSSLLEQRLRELKVEYNTGLAPQLGLAPDEAEPPRRG
ncbi:MAG TPA: peptidyl-prolyl cis-trans isomerase [Thermoanaerobaculia bacterium]|nr:peptidyl-prolyl cis-trans isomerase [Thermoanaerobaculia bacterium]